METAVPWTKRPSTSTVPSMKRPFPTMGMSSRSSRGAPISTDTSTAWPSRTRTFMSIMPACVLIRIISEGARAKSYRCLATHLMPLPHISASLPSEFSTLMNASASLSGFDVQDPVRADAGATVADPAHEVGSRPARPARGSSTTTKSLPSPWYFQKIIASAWPAPGHGEGAHRWTPSPG